MTITANGYIATEDDNVDWISKESWQSYLNTIRKVDSVIIGRRTYDLMPRKEFQKNCEYVVLTHRKPAKSKSPNVIFTNRSPKEIINFLNRRGFKRICIAGGGKTNSAFMKSGLIDEIYLDVEPIILGKGISLFFPTKFSHKLKLLGIGKLNENTLHLHYKILR